MDELKIEYVDIDQIKPYENNAKLHPDEQVDQIKESMLEFGFKDPIGVWKDNTIIEGHGRLMAASQLVEEGHEEFRKVPIIRLDDLTDEQRRAYTLVHNKLTTNSDFDLDILGSELSNITGINMADYGFTDEDLDIGGDLDDGKYTLKVKIPQYEITGKCPNISDLVNTDKTDSLVEKIKQSGVTEKEKEFLIKAAQRHEVFNYRNIAEYYAHATPEMQELMEESALVIIDVGDAIANGYAELSEDIKDMTDEG